MQRRLEQFTFDPEGDDVRGLVALAERFDKRAGAIAGDKNLSSIGRNNRLLTAAQEPHAPVVAWEERHVGVFDARIASETEALRLVGEPAAPSDPLERLTREIRHSEIRQNFAHLYFQRLIDELREKHRFTGARVGQPQNWYSFASGFSGVTYGAGFALGGRARTELGVDRGDSDANEKLFDRLLEDKAGIEEEYGAELDWERLDGKRACRIADYREGSISDSESTLLEIQAWHVDGLLRMKKVFDPRLGHQHT